MANVHPIVEPDAGTMLAHVEHLFGGFLDGYHDGLIELAWTDSTPDKTGRHKLRHARLFKTDQLDELVDEAVKFNRVPGVNVYIGAWLRHPDTAPFGRGEDKDAWALTAPYVDLDDQEAAAQAKNLYDRDKPTWITVTGREPHLRAQGWWRLAEPITDHERGTALMRGLAYALKGDDTVCNPGRVMRLAGSLAWPVKDGRVLELTRRAPLKEPGPSIYAAEHLESRFPPIAALQSDVTGAIDTGPSPIRAGSLGLGNIKDGRERYMRDTVLACLIEYMGQHGAEPSPQELFDAAWPQYERNVDFSRPGRGKDELAEKCATALRRFQSGKVRGVETIDRAIEIYARKQGARAATGTRPAPEAVDLARQDTGIATVDFVTLLTEHVVEEPEYIEPDFAGPGNFVLIAGPPKAQKSFLLQEMLVACATGKKFLCGVFNAPRPLRVFYLQAEMNRKLLRKRAREMTFLSAEDRALLAVNLIMSERFHMILNDDGVKIAIETIKAAFPSDPPDLIGIDPLANVFDQENENDNAQVMRFLTGRIEAIRQRVNPLACVIMAHHATKKSSEDLARDPFVAIRGASALRGYYDSAIVIYRKGEESKARNIHFELRGGESPEPMTVELISGRFQKVSELASITKDVARQILKAVEDAWNAGYPWSLYPHAQAKGRFATANVVRKFGLSREAVDVLFQAWIENGIVTFQERVSRGRPAGLEVTGSID